MEKVAGDGEPVAGTGETSQDVDRTGAWPWRRDQRAQRGNALDDESFSPRNGRCSSNRQKKKKGRPRKAAAPLHASTSTRQQPYLLTLDSWSSPPPLHPHLSTTRHRPVSHPSPSPTSRPQTAPVTAAPSPAHTSCRPPHRGGCGVEPGGSRSKTRTSTTLPAVWCKWRRRAGPPSLRRAAHGSGWGSKGQRNTARRGRTTLQLSETLHNTPDGGTRRPASATRS